MKLASFILMILSLLGMIIFLPGCPPTPSPELTLGLSLIAEVLLIQWEWLSLTMAQSVSLLWIKLV